MKNILFDSYAILTFYQDEDGADKVEKFLTSSRQGNLQGYISEINLGEVYYKTIRRLGLEPAKRQLEYFYELYPSRLFLPPLKLYYQPRRSRQNMPSHTLIVLLLLLPLNFQRRFLLAILNSKG